MFAQTVGHTFADNAELYAACRSGDRLVQAAAYETLWGYLYRVAFQVLRDQPEPEMLAQDCAQDALIRVHERLAECREPAAFRAWARRIVTNLAIDTLRRSKWETLPGEDEWDRIPASDPPQPEKEALEHELFALISQAPISDRSRRVVLGRYLDGVPDERLAREESRRANRSVLPSHVQVTRSKDINRLRSWAPLEAFRDQ
jgi:RNA polymerase sigma factor (sigma-70 family)